MQKSYHPRNNFTRIVEDTTVELQPGEPAPPGMEDMVEPKKCIIQAKLDLFKGKPLIGLEYLIELIIDDNSEPTYCCLLCNKQGPNNNIMTHLSSQQHYLKYLQSYFTGVYNALVLVPKSSEYKKGFSIILSRIISRIETKFGRLKPRQCNADSFPQKKMELLRTIEEEFHFRETMHDDYVKMVDWAEMKKLQFYNEDEVTAVKPDATTPNDAERNPANKSLFNKVGRINVDKRQLRKDRQPFEDNAGSTDANQNSPDLIIIEDIPKPDDKEKKKPEPRRKSLSSISTVSSVSSKRSISRSRSPRSRMRSPVGSRYRHRRSRSRSPASRRRHYISAGHHRHSRSRSRTPSARYRYRSRSRSHSGSRYGRSRRDRSPHLPYPRRRHTFSRSHSRSPRSRGSRSPRPRHSRSPPSRFRRYVRPKVPIGSSGRPMVSKEDTSSQKYKWEKFREDLRLYAKELDDKLKYYEKNPEKHPQYPEEWKVFWNRRYKELQTEGKDPAKHDFKPEWITFWNKRMKEIHDEEFKNGKEKLREKIGLNEEDMKKKESDCQLTDNKPDERMKDVTVDDIKNTWKALTGSEIKESTPSPSVIEENENLYEENFENRHVDSHLRSRLPPPGARKGFIPFDDNAPRVVSVLRLITVLESQLGSLGPKVVSLLSKALAMEKVCKGSSQDILCDEEQCVLFETVKEKLKGLLFAGLVDRNFVNATKVALRNIEDLFSCAPKMSKRERTLHSAPPAPPADPVSVPGIGTVDRVAIAQQIAGALIAQGKTDVTEDELEQLINAVVGMAQASSNSSKPITTAAYVSQQTQNCHPGSEIPTGRVGGIGGGLPASGEVQSSSGGLRLLQSAYDEEDKRGPMEGKSELCVRKLPVVNATNSLNSFTKDLTDKDLKCLLENFRDLLPNEQSKLISYFKKLESSEPARIVALQKEVNLHALLGLESDKVICSDTGSQLSPFTSKSGDINLSADQQPQKISDGKNDGYDDDDDDEDDDDYSVEDVYKAASENLRQQELTQERKKIESMLADIVEAAKKGDSVGDLSETLQFSKSPKNLDSDEKVQHASFPGPQSSAFANSFQETTNNKNVTSYPVNYYQQQPYQQSAVTSHRMMNYDGGVYDRNTSFPYGTEATTPSAGKFSENIHPVKRDSIMNSDTRPPYADVDNNRSQFPFNRDFPTTRHLPPVQSQLQQHHYSQSRNNYPRY
ncbi:uncharacterized protein CG7065-like isoform X2 [Lycorma delicatula]